MRGKVLSHLPSIVNKGITPAYAGKSPCCRRSCPCTRDHPRLCGEKLFEFGNSDFMMGSPPPMRGKVADFFHRAGKLRITPAYAGKSPAIRLLQFLLWDHPRLCGEKASSAASVFPGLGSPPPMRGKADSNRVRRNQNRITPAYAGKSGIGICRSFFAEDHPRLCGEKIIQNDRLLFVYGSPPPMRGKAAPPLLVLASCGITPAYAGKSSKITSIFFMIKDHPRLCGEKYRIFVLIGHSKGSPPPMRGKASGFDSLIAVFGITPAYAGKSVRQSRTCGNGQGSPPPMRGKVPQLDTGSK